MYDMYDTYESFLDDDDYFDDYDDVYESYYDDDYYDYWAFEADEGEEESKDSGNDKVKEGIFAKIKKAINAVIQKIKNAIGWIKKKIFKRGKDEQAKSKSSSSSSNSGMTYNEFNDAGNDFFKKYTSGEKSGVNAPNWKRPTSDSNYYSSASSSSSSSASKPAASKPAVNPPNPQSPKASTKNGPDISQKVANLVGTAKQLCGKANKVVDAFRNNSYEVDSALDDLRSQHEQWYSAVQSLPENGRIVTKTDQALLAALESEKKDLEKLQNTTLKFYTASKNHKGRAGINDVREAVTIAIKVANETLSIAHKYA